MYFFELSRTMKDVYFANMTSMSSKCFNGDGIHLNLMGKQNNNNSKQNNLLSEVKTYDINTQTKFLCKEKHDTPNGMTTYAITNT